MGDVVPLRSTRKKVRRDAVREINRMYRLSHGGEDPIASEASRELFELGLVDEVKWQDWQTYCRTMLSRGPGDAAEFSPV
jgi:hypothetical protein